jgi:hypothetical protein
MNKQNLQIAVQAGLQQRIDNPNEIWGYRDDLQRFAELVRQDEREACAKLCDEWSASFDEGEYMAKAIRARAEK